MGQTQVAKEAILLQRLFEELGGLGNTEPKAVVIYSDNQGAIALAKNPANHQRTKHIDIQQHFVREKVAEGKIAMQFVPTGEMVADGLTKPLAKDAFLRFRAALGFVKEPQGRTDL